MCGVSVQVNTVLVVCAGGCKDDIHVHVHVCTRAKGVRALPTHTIQASFIGSINLPRNPDVHDLPCVIGYSSIS